MGVNPPRDDARLLGWAQQCGMPPERSGLWPSRHSAFRSWSAAHAGAGQDHGGRHRDASDRTDRRKAGRGSAPRADLPPGTYRVAQKYRFAENRTATWSGELTSGELALGVVAAGGPPLGFRGLDLTNAPRTTDVAKLPDLFEERPPGSKSYEVRKDVVVTHQGLDGTVYYLPAKKAFYVQHDPMGSSRLTYYGPFAGDLRQVLKPAADAKAPAKAAKKPPPPAPTEQATVEFSGQVVDAESGFPIESFTLQWGWPDPANPSKIGWGGISSHSSRRAEGRFSEKSGWPKGKKVGLRVLADGYLPQPVTPDELVEAPAAWINLVVRLKRGSPIRGRVLDHAGKPVGDASVYLAGNQMLNLKDGIPEYFSGSTAATDVQGRFTLSGGGSDKSRLVVTSAALAVWTAPVPEAGKEATITLPQPAVLKVRCDIPGAGDDSSFRIELRTWEMEGWKGIVDPCRYPSVPNSGENTWTNLTPGTYDFSRTKQLRMGDRGQGAMLDRRDVTLQAGKTAEIQLVRKTGQPIAGELTGLKGTGVPGAFIFVKGGQATGDPRKTEEWKVPMFDAAVCAVDGQFKTETLSPASTR